MKRPHVVILAGGKGTRFWPLGRETRPKQLLALDGDDPRPLLEVTWDRVSALCDARGPWVVAPASLAADVRRLVPVARERLLLEPRGRDTAAAVALAAHAVHAEAPGTAVVVVPSDHHAAPLLAYRIALRAMLHRAAEADALLTLGLRPTRPATGYGYLRLGPLRAASPAGPIHAVSRFVEKPDLPRAKRFVRDGKHLWNGGTFAFRPAVFLEECARHAPAVAGALAPVFARRLGLRRRLARAWAHVPSISVDHAVLEHSDRVETLAARFEWDDLGSFEAVARHGTADAAGNVLPRGAVAVDARDCFVRAADGSTVALLGVEGLVVVRTRDALLVTRKGRGEDVRRVVEALRAAGREDLLR